MCLKRNANNRQKSALFWCNFDSRLRYQLAHDLCFVWFVPTECCHTRGKCNKKLNLLFICICILTNCSLCFHFVLFCFGFWMEWRSKTRLLCLFVRLNENGMNSRNNGFELIQIWVEFAHETQNAFYENKIVFILLKFIQQSDDSHPCLLVRLRTMMEKYQNDKK